MKRQADSESESTAPANKVRLAAVELSEMERKKIKEYEEEIEKLRAHNESLQREIDDLTLEENETIAKLGIENTRLYKDLRRLKVDIQMLEDAMEEKIKELHEKDELLKRLDADDPTTMSAELETRSRPVKDGSSEELEEVLALIIRYPRHLRPAQNITPPSRPQTTSDWREAASEYLDVNASLSYSEFVRFWAAKERSTNKTVGISVSKIDQAFGSSFPPKVWRWWFHIQPKARGPPVDKFLPPFDGKWNTLDRWGEDGWVLALVALKWWWLGIDKLENNQQESAKAEWETILQEMLSTFRAVTGTGTVRESAGEVSNR
ncbi:hypothetical protein E1B28_002264 [Marasmius oreades]|uniref:Uncharacterized protein n=1 Tax=Marasmius oreades TaxID=181124 RepID=A0A9P7ULD6_9AGAR|nr:uncharacterized protein E1B28_002264 [Marasmius oreades]KAG7086300.1 hypothetical protein E1B28_002264 [Marasmius oreades]